MGAPRYATYSDKHMTDPRVAQVIVRNFPVKLPALDPAKGEGAFLEAMPSGTRWCEIDQGIDFFEWRDPVRWIVTNPPYSTLTRWMEHAFGLAENVVFLVPLSKLFNSPPRMKLVARYGNIREVLYLGSGRSIGFDQGFAFGAIWFKRGYGGSTKWTWLQGAR